jgi:hypothetical protein
VDLSSRYREWLWGALGFVLSVIAMELLLHGIEQSPAWRILPIVERELGWPDPETGYALRPDRHIINVRENRSRVSTNSFGMRDKERSLAKSSHSYRAVVTGDSFTEALQVNDAETFTRLAEAALNPALNQREYEILNFGMSGAGPVQQYVQLHHVALDFNPDAIVMILSADQFLTQELADDSLNPAYVYNFDGQLELGYAFRQRPSQRYRDTLLGKFFFRLMDDSRVARAVYLRYATGGSSAALLPPSHGGKAARLCSAVRLRLERHLKLWQAHEPALAFARIEKFMLDLAGITSAREIDVALLLYGFGDARTDCGAAAHIRTTLRTAIERVVAPHGFRAWDADQMLSVGRPTLAVRSHQHGFGGRRGVGHLNHNGHRAYSELLGWVVTELHGNGQE